MNEFSNLENQLKKLRPRRPAPELTERIERALSHARPAPGAAVIVRRRRIRFDWVALGAGLAAAALLLIFVELRSERPQTTRIAFAPSPPAAAARNGSSSFYPEGVTRVVYDTRDEGVYFPSGSEQPVRRIRSRARETLHWRNPSTGASLRVSYPAEEVSLIPVSGQ